MVWFLALCSMLLGVVTATPAGAAAAEEPETVTSFAFTSDPGNDIADGAAGAYAPPLATFRLFGGGMGPPTTGELRVDIEQGSEDWSVTLAAPEGRQLRPGEYGDAEEAPFHDDDAAGLYVSGNGRACNQVHGDFVIYSISTDPAGAVTSLDAAFTQRCGSPDAPALRGVIRYLAPDGPITVTSSMPKSVRGDAVLLTARVPAADEGMVRFRAGGTVLGKAPVDRNGLASFETENLPAGTHEVTASYAGRATGGSVASRPLAQRVAKSTTSFSFASGADHYLGRGASVALTPEDANIIVEGTTACPTLRVVDRAGRSWTVELATPPIVVSVPLIGTLELCGEPLRAGTYDDARTGERGHPVLDVSGWNRACNDSHGRFVIDRIDGDALGRVTRLDASFVHRCGGPDAPAMSGRLRYDSPAPSTTAVEASAPVVRATESVTLTATVTGTNGPRSGEVEFRDGLMPLGRAVLDEHGIARLTTSLPPVAGDHHITADYRGSRDYEPSTGATTTTVTV